MIAVSPSTVNGIPVRLSWYELWIAASVGAKRQIEAIQRGLSDQHGFTGENGWNLHLEGAAGEMAAAKAMNRFYSGSINTFKDGGDVGSIQGRTRSKSEYELIVRANDRDEDIFVLVTWRSPTFTVHGWIRGQDAKQTRWLRTHGNRPAAYFVPTAELRAIGEMK